MTQPRKHHYNPRSILRRFSIEGGGKQVYVFDKATGRSFVNSIDNAGAERDFNTVEAGGSTISFEPLFDDPDGQLAQLVDRLIVEQTVACLDPDERRTLARVVAMQVLRTKMPRTSMQSIMEQLRQRIAAWGWDPEELANGAVPTDQETRRAALEMLLRPDELAASIEQKRMFLIRATPEQPLWTSDNPVALQQTYPYGDLGVSAPGIEIYFPISRDLALAFYCPSIELQMERALRLRPPGFDVDKFTPVYRGLQTGAAVSFGSDTTRFLNELQVLRSSQFLYSPTEGFDLARRVIERLPHARTIKGLVGTGTLGQRRPRMPPGLCIVFFGRDDHHVLHVEQLVPNEDGFMTVTTRDVETLQRVLDDHPLVEAVLYEDGHGRQGMRAVRVEVSGDAPPLRLCVLHQDEAQNQLMRQIARERFMSR